MVSRPFPRARPTLAAVFSEQFAAFHVQVVAHIIVVAVPQTFGAFGFDEGFHQGFFGQAQGVETNEVMEGIAKIFGRILALNPNGNILGQFTIGQATVGLVFGFELLGK